MIFGVKNATRNMKCQGVTKWGGFVIDGSTFTGLVYAGV